MEVLIFSDVQRVWVCIISSVIFLVIWYISKQIDFYVRNIPPGPVGLPFFGYILFLSKHFYKDLPHLNRRYGNICSFTILTTRYIFVSDYDTAKELLSHPSVLSRPDHFFDLMPGKAGLAGMSGKRWFQERRLAVQALRNVGIGKGRWTDNVREEILKLVNSMTSSSGEPMDICSLLSMSAVRNVISLTLGRKYLNNMTNDDFESLFKADKISGEELQKAPVFSVFPWLLKLLLTFNISGYRNRKELLDEFAENVKRAIEERLKAPFDDEDATDFIMQYFAELKKKTNSEVIEDSSVESLVGNIGVFMNTSRTGMFATHWILYAMAAYPKIQGNVHDQIDKEMGRNSTITWDDRIKLPYVLACILEILRWVAIVLVFTPRRADRTFKFNGYTIPQGTVIIGNGWGINRDPKYWDNPDEYIPERFLRYNIEKLEKVGGYAPFSFGKRSCPFDNISVMITFLYFTEIMQKFEIRTPSGEPPDLTPLYTIVLEPKNQDLCFKRRE